MNPCAVISANAGIHFQIVRKCAGGLNQLTAFPIKAAGRKAGSYFLDSNCGWVYYCLT